MSGIYLKDVTVKIAEYHNEHRHPAKAVIGLSDLYDLFPHREKRIDLEVSMSWPGTWPNCTLKGVYVVFDGNLELLYIGKASMKNPLGARLSSWFMYEEDKTCKVNGTWNKQPRYVATVGFDDDTSFEAPALEEFLIQRLQPQENIRGRD